MNKENNLENFPKKEWTAPELKEQDVEQTNASKVITDPLGEALAYLS